MNDEPFVLYKFKPINKFLIESLVNQSLYFPKLEKLNDPFDCNMELIIVLTRAEKSAKGDRKNFLSSILGDPKFFENWKSYIDNIGVFSFSRENSNMLMWAHYADAHRGVCLEYQFRESHFLTPEFGLTAAGNVEYISEPLFEWLRNDAPLEMTPFIEGLIHRYLKTKSPAWAYEKEARIIRNKEGAFNVGKSFLRRVYFGLRTSQVDIDLVTKLARDYSGCTSFAQIVRDDTEFGFTVKPLA
jgi:hypothetical protein